MPPRRSFVGWVERSETHHSSRWVSLRSTHPPDHRRSLPRLQLAHREQLGRAALDEARRLGRRVFGEIELLDAAGALLDLVGRDQDLADVLVGVAEMLLQLEHAIAQAAEIVAEM